MPHLEIRNAPSTLRDEIHRLHRITHEEHRQRQPYAHPPDNARRLTKLVIDAAFQSDGRPVSESELILAAHMDEVFCGYILLSPSAREKALAGSASIWDIYVFPEYRRMGVGRALVEYVKALSVTRDWDNLTADVWSLNPASDALFRSAEFVTQSTTLRFGPDRQCRDRPLTLESPPWWRRIDRGLWETFLIVAMIVVLLLVASRYVHANSKRPDPDLCSAG